VPCFDHFILIQQEIDAKNLFMVVVMVQKQRIFHSKLLFNFLGNANRFENEEECLAKCGGNQRKNGTVHEEE
jgi:hypothetical protein